MVTSAIIESPAQRLVNILEATRRQAAEQERLRQQQRQAEIRRARERQIEGIGARQRAARSAAALRESRDPRVTPEQLGQRPTTRVIDLRRESPDEGAFRELVRGYVSGELDVDVLAEAGRPASSVITLSPARTQKFLREQAAAEADTRELERLTAALERGQQLKPAPEQIDIPTPLPGAEINLRLSPTQREILGAVRDVAIGRRVREISPQAESVLRDQISDILERRMPRQEFFETLADLGWTDQFEKRHLQGRTLQEALLTQPQRDTGEFIFQDRALQTFFNRQQARREELAAFGVTAGATPIFSASLPLRGVIRTLREAPRATGRNFARKLSTVIKEERGLLLPGTQEQVQLLKRGRGRTQPTPIPVESQPLGIATREAPARPAIPGRFDPDTFDPFRPLAPDVPDDPLRVIRRQRRITRTIEVPDITEPPTPARGPTPAQPPRTTPVRGPIISPTSDPIAQPEGIPSISIEAQPELSPAPEAGTIQQAAVSPGAQTGTAPALAPELETPPAPAPELAAPPAPAEETAAPPAPPKPPAPPAPPKPPAGRPPRIPPGDEPETDRQRARRPVRIGDQFARTVGWRQGAFWKTLNLVTGEETSLSQPPAGIRQGVTPEETFTILEFNSERPVSQSFNMGIVNVDVNTRSINFRRRKSKSGSANMSRERRVTQRGLDRGRI